MRPCLESLRLQFPGAHYHVMARGNRWESIFADDEAGASSSTPLGQACQRTGWRVLALPPASQTRLPKPLFPAHLQGLPQVCRTIFPPEIFFFPLHT